MLHILFTASGQLKNSCEHGNELPSSTNVRNFQTSWEAISFSRRPLPQSYGSVTQSVSQLFSQLVWRMLGKVSLCLNFLISQYFQVTFIETSFIFTVLTKFHGNFSSDIVRCLAVLWLISLSFKTTYFIISTFPFITEHLNYIYSLLSFIPSSPQVINISHNSAWNFSFLQNWDNYCFHEHFSNSYTMYPHQDLTEVTTEQNKP